MHIYALNIRRDAHTTTPVEIPEHEVAIVQELFGTENVHNVDGKRIDEVGLGAPLGEVKDADDEYARLSAKYGVEIVEEIYGKKASKQLEKAMEAAAKKAKK